MQQPQADASQPAVQTSHETARSQAARKSWPQVDMVQSIRQSMHGINSRQQRYKLDLKTAGNEVLGRQQGHLLRTTRPKVREHKTEIHRGWRRQRISPYPPTGGLTSGPTASRK